MKEKTTIMEKLRTKKSKLCVTLAAVIGCVLAMAVPLTASAEEVNNGAFPVTADMLVPVTTNMNAAINVAVPVGLGIMSILLGIYLIPKLVKRLAK